MILAAYNPKGGAGKTTTAVNVATVLAGLGKSVLLIDLEADLNASISVGVRPVNAAPSIAEVMLHDVRAADAMRQLPGIENLFLITGSPRLADMDAALRHVRQPERRLGDVVRPLAPQFDAIVLDAPSGFSLVAQGVTLVAEHLIVPLRAEYLSLESLAQFLRWYRDRSDARAAVSRIAGILLTMVDYRTPATREIVDIIRMHNRRGVFRTEIPNDVRVAEAPSHGLPLVAYAPSSRATRAYEQVTAELLKRIK